MPTETLREDDYEHVTEDPSSPASMEVDRVEEEAGRSAGEVNATSHTG